MKKKMDHAAYKAKVRKLEVPSLLFSMRDAAEALAAYPTGENAGYYADEVLYCAEELRRRGIDNA